MSSVQVIYDDESFSVVYTNDKGVSYDVGFGDKDTIPEQHAYNFYEVLACLGVKVTLTEAT